MYIALLGRQPALGMAELERRYGEDATSWFSDVSAKISTDTLSIEQLGGIQKAGQVVIELPGGDWRILTPGLALMARLRLASVRTALTYHLEKFSKLASFSSKS